MRTEGQTLTCDVCGASVFLAHTGDGEADGGFTRWREYEKPRLLDIKNCPDVCARAKWYQDPMFPDLGQHNCPYHFGVDYFAAIQDGVVHCKHLKPKEDA